MMIKMYKNIIELDIWSRFGSFSKPFSNSGGILTYLIPPKTSIIGMIGAVLGYKFDDFTLDENNKKVFSIEELYDIKISIQPLFSLKTKKVIFNLVSGNGISNINQEILLNPYYKLFISFPTSFIEKEQLFLDRIKNNQSVFNLYMGRNEFLLNYKLVNYYENVAKFTLNNSNKKSFFEDNLVYGSLNRLNIKSAILKEDKEYLNIPKALLKYSPSEPIKIGDYYEYIIKDYPIKRENFLEFSYSPISFYSMKEGDDFFFTCINLKDDLELDLYELDENKWISLI